MRELLTNPRIPKVQAYHNGGMERTSWDSGYSAGYHSNVENAKQVLKPGTPTYRDGQLEETTWDTGYHNIDAARSPPLWKPRALPYRGGMLEETHYDTVYSAEATERRNDTADQFEIGVAVSTPDHSNSSKGMSDENHAFTAASSRSSLNLNETGMKSLNFSFDFGNDRAAASKLQAEWAVENDVFTDTLKFAFDLDDATPINQFHFDHLVSSFSHVGLYDLGIWSFRDMFQEVCFHGKLQIYVSEHL